MYVDDIFLIRNNVEEIHNLKSFLAKVFEIKDLGNLKQFSQHEDTMIKTRDFGFPMKVCVGPLELERNARTQASGQPIEFQLKIWR